MRPPVRPLRAEQRHRVLLLEPLQDQIQHVHVEEEVGESTVRVVCVHVLHDFVRDHERITAKLAYTCARIALGATRSANTAV